MEQEQEITSLRQELPCQLAAGDMHWIHRNLGRRPIWEFPDQLLGEGLRCVRLGFNNFDEIWPLLAEGDTTFVQREYRERDRLYRQLLSTYGYAPYSANNGAADYIIINAPEQQDPPRAFTGWGGSGYLRLSETESIAGLLHLYELSRERLGTGDGQRNPFVGIQLTDVARGSGVADRALDLLEWHVARSYPDVHAVTAQIMKANERSQRFFARRGYAKTTDYGAFEETLYMTKTLR